MFSELSIGSREDDATLPARAEQPSCSDKATVDTSRNAVTKAVNHAGSSDGENSQYEIESSRHELCDSSPVSVTAAAAPLSPGSSMRHSASDSQVYRADIVELSSTSHEAVTDCLRGEPMPSSGALNGYCKAVEETSVSQVVHGASGGDTVQNFHQSIFVSLGSESLSVEEYKCSYS